MKQTTSLTFVKDHGETFSSKVLVQKFHYDNISFEQNEIYGLQKEDGSKVD
jgi:hypothetical protein